MKKNGRSKFDWTALTISSISSTKTEELRNIRMKNEQKIFSCSQIFLRSSPSHLLLLFLMIQSLFIQSQSTSEYFVTTLVSSSDPSFIAMSPFNEMVYITERGTSKIRVVNRTSSSSSLSGIYIPNMFGICLSNISPEWGLVTSTNRIIYQIYFETNSVVTLAGQSAQGMVNGQGTNAKFDYPYGIALSPDDSYALVADHNNHLIRKITMATASVETFAGMSGSGGIVPGVGTNARFNRPIGVAISPDGTFALVSNYGGQVINKIILTTAEVSILAGAANSPGSANGFGTNAQFNSPHSLAISPTGAFSVVADTWNHQIRLIHISTSEVTTLAGTGSAGNTNGAATSAQFNLPRGVAISSQAEGSYVLVADYSNSAIRKISLPSTPKTSPISTPTAVPSSAPSVPPITRFSFGVKIGDERVLSPCKAILIDYLQDARRGHLLLPSLSSLISLCFREDVSCISRRQRISRLVSFRLSIVIGFHSHQVASRDSSSRNRILGQWRQPHDHHHSWRRRCVSVLARESLE
jgi:DNA-binding beta-propeller fold protein YncE